MRIEFGLGTVTPLERQQNAAILEIEPHLSCFVPTGSPRVAAGGDKDLLRRERLDGDMAQPQQANDPYAVGLVLPVHI